MLKTPEEFHSILQHSLVQITNDANHHSRKFISPYSSENKNKLNVACSIIQNYFEKRNNPVRENKFHCKDTFKKHNYISENKFINFD